MQVEYQISAEAIRLLERAQSLLVHCNVESGVCGCGGDMNNHSYYDGHSPVDYGQYVADQLLKDIQRFLDIHQSKPID